MRTLLLVLSLCTSVSSWAAERHWQEAEVAAITNDDSTVAVVPFGTGGALVGGRIVKTYYWMKTPEMVYVLMLNPFNSWNKHPLDVALHGKTKIAIDGSNAHVLEDSGKERKLPIVRKIARPQPPSTQTAPAPAATGVQPTGAK